MRILIYAIDFAPKIGGEETYLLLLAGGLTRRFSGAGSALIERAPHTVIVATRTSADGFDDATLPFPVVRRPGLATLWRLLGEADVVHLSGPVLIPLLLGWLRGKPIVITHHMYHSACPSGSHFYEPRGVLCPGHFRARRYHECLRCVAASSGWQESVVMVLATVVRRWLCRQAAVNISVSEYLSGRIALPRTETIYIGVPDSRASESPVMNVPRVRRSWTFAYVGRLAKEKGLPVLLEAVKRLRQEGYDCYLKCIGDGPARPFLEAQVASLALQQQVRFLGFLQGEALHTATADVTALVMPSVCEETAGVAAVEQMMRGGLVIASDVGGLGEIVDNAGFKFRPGHVDDLTSCLRIAMNKPAQVIDMVSKARKRAVKLFGQERMVEEHHKLYENLLCPKTAAIVRLEGASGCDERKSVE